MNQEITEVRVDKWLWAARFFKTRSLAQEAVELGRVRIAGQRIKPSRCVKVGDRLQIDRAEEHFDIFVENLALIRGPASVAQALYRETEESKEKRERSAQMRRIAVDPAASIEKGRPTKRDARMLRRLRDKWN